MRVIIDADACPIIKIATKICQENQVECVLVCDDSHVMTSEYASVITVEKSSDSADYKIIALVKENDIVLTNDYGLSALALAKKCMVMDFNGKQISELVIDSMLNQRAYSAKLRKSNIRTKGPKKRVKDQDDLFIMNFKNLLDLHKVNI